MAATQPDPWDELVSRIVQCERCPRLVAYRRRIASERRRAFADWEYWGRPVPGFGDRQGRLLILGLAPAAHGANRTGRMFTGDSSGDFLMGALWRAGFANQPRSERRDDGLRLVDAFVSAPVRCAPPDNRPLREEFERCFAYLQAEWALLTRVQVVLALGRIAFGTAKRLVAPRLDDEARRALQAAPFRHGAVVPLGRLTLVASYHPSRQNTQTGRLTPAMMDAVLQEVRRLLDATEPAAAAPPGAP
ncbi:uracil-DNA glycosylase [Geochorda subterranea]|uniref:Type-5 uracil-DNA glycosylase n=1 Tax=Geochorda subterranea TaxID=3109564 RepID=A0ABZ1BLX6_9FIRM|nr:uracil-DNA glycosylase [Limnochorda sp. LNt]WRP13535.1 uracil-DNA glycosylase [Limnochorda sp. LNt]